VEALQWLQSKLPENYRTSKLAHGCARNFVRRVRELECRFTPAPRDMRELARLKEFLKVTPITERDGRESSARPPLTTPNGLGEFDLADDDLITRADPRNQWRNEWQAKKK
jgi:hypothetical protein